MSQVQKYLQRKERFALTGAWKGLSTYPAGDICVLTCLDPRTDPADLLQLDLGDAAIIRNAGGRVTQSVIDDLALINYLSDRKIKPGDSPLFEVALINHNKCGTRFLADDDFRRDFARAAHLNEGDLQAEAVTDPRETVRIDVEKLLAVFVLSPRMSVSGHVYDVDSGTLSTIVQNTPIARHDPPKARPARPPERYDHGQIRSIHQFPRHGS